ncbi:PQLLE family protein [Labilibaculum euxinus]
MWLSPSRSESKFFERVRIALTNAESHYEIKAALIEYGVNETFIAEGWQVFNRAKEAWEQNKMEVSETKLASNVYHKAYHELEMKFKRHRDLSLILFKKDPDMQILLGIKGRFPVVYNKFFDNVKLYYTSIITIPEVQNRMAVIKITPEVATSQLSELDRLLTLRADFDKEKGESQDTTVSKNTALHELSEWMDNFDILAEIALYDNPQRLEVLGLLVKS